MLNASDRIHEGSDRAASLPGPLTPEQLAAYQRLGWIVAPRFFTPETATAVARWCDELVALPEEPGRHMVYHEPSLVDPDRSVIQRIENFCPYHDDFDAFVRTGALRAAVEQLLEAPACLFKEKINFKMPGGAGFEPHQDQQAGWSRYAEMFVTAVVTIDSATIENGCLEIADAARVTGMIGEQWRPLQAEEMRGFALLALPTEPGDVIFFDSYVPHASKPNLTEEQRRILYLTYNAAAAGDHYKRYYAEKRRNFPPDVERLPGRTYKFRV